ncbi:hypothetical protein F991_01756 [Acinetobacter sp. CIP-A165]|uniref:hypothetical protein n=1 Tax=Acinetobacter sp. CIP-A165 TaxID=40373 RepID=UPI0002CD74D5|nr:hypothetical protein [Acinetobacter sp. CIP-A165]ENU30361.1 hypothetical protein F991_01756 [Acinetobacter sp. CIP-A165]
MKKLVLVIAPVVLAFAGCAATDTNNTATTSQQLGVAALKVAVNAKCLNEINNVAACKTATRFMTTEQRNDIQTNVCGCVSDKAPESVTTFELATAAIDPSARATIVNKVVSETVNACVNEALKQAK